MEKLDRAHSVWLNLFLPPYAEREKNHLNVAQIAFADGGNRTRAACTASEYAIHYSIVSWLNNLKMMASDRPANPELKLVAVEEEKDNGRRRRNDFLAKASLNFGLTFIS